MNKLHKWLELNKLTINISKTFSLEFLQRSNTTNILININNEPVKQATQTKYLGLSIQTNLKWTTHIKNITNKVKKYIPLMYTFRKKHA